MCISREKACHKPSTPKMVNEIHILRHFFFFYKFLLKLLGYPQSSHWKNKSYDSQLKHMKYKSFAHRHTSEELKKTTLVFDVEGALLRSSSLFPYFMLVAFEGGGVFRALVLFLLYPFVCLVSKRLGLKIMVFICFFGVRKEGFKIGRTVLPKFFLEDVGFEGFEEVVMRCGRKVGLTELPTVMVEGFLKDHLGCDCVLGRDLKVVCGYFVGLIEEVKRTSSTSSSLMNDVFGDMKLDSNLIGFACSNMFLDHQLFSLCKEVYWVSEAEKRRWEVLPRQKYTKPLIFHDGRIAFRPTFLATLSMFMWLPFGFCLSVLRIIIAVSFPYVLAIPILSFTGMSGRKFVKSNTCEDEKRHKEGRGMVYVCNHKTLLDPVYISLGLMKPVTAATYSVSKFSELLSPIRTAHLKRNKEKDSKMMEMLLSQGDLVVCPEGTTCREPYILRFSPLFAELSDDIVPIALDVKVSMFYGTTASGFKFLDPVYFLLNPLATYSVNFLEKLPSYRTCSSGKSSIEVANWVQKEIGQVLGFECTNLTRKDKYMILAGNEGTIEERSRKRN